MMARKRKTIAICGKCYKDENAQLKKRIKELEKALSFSKLETEAQSYHGETPICSESS